MESATYNKFNRIISILTQLQTKKIIRAQELADRFRVSIRTIYRDIQSLELAGIPIIGEAGTGYSLMEGFKMPPIIFTKEEATALLTAQKLMHKYQDDSIKEVLDTAMSKVRAVLNWSDKSWVETLNEHIHVHSSENLYAHAPKDLIISIINAIGQQRQLLIHYKDSNEQVSNRNIEAIGLFQERKFWYIMAYCHLRLDYRQFRLDRIIKIEQMTEVFTLTHQSLNHYLSHNDAGQVPVHKVVLSFPKDIAKYTEESRDSYGFVEAIHHGNEVDLHFMVSDDLLQYLARWFLMYADVATIHASPKMSSAVHALLAKIQANLGS